MFWLLLLFSYLLGSVSFAILLSKITGKTDPRSLGSGNPGATNMMRVAGIRLAIFTLIGDLIKGILPVFIAKQVDFTLEQQAWIGIGAVIGHLYPLYFRFKGGKGVATAAGMVLALSPLIGMVAMMIWGVTFYMTRTSSLSALLALAMMMIISILFEHTILLPFLTLCTLILWRHRRNLRDLMAGRERHF